VLDTDEIYVKLETDYPFKNIFKYTVKAKKDVKFSIRIPSFAQAVIFDGKRLPTEDITISLKAGDEGTHILVFDADAYLEARPHGLCTVKSGSLVFSIPVSYEKKMHEYEKNGVERKFPYCDYEYIRTSDFGYALTSDEFEIECRDVSDVPFSSTEPAVVVHARVAPIDWGYEDGFNSVCAKVPHSTEPTGEEREIELYPYGSAKLRVTEIPKI
jgi:hypothetical protein